MQLSDIVEKLEGAVAEGDLSLAITDVTERADQAFDGSIFVCRKGLRFDGNDFVFEARMRGARAFVSSEKIEINSGECLIISNNPRKTMAEIAFAIFGRCVDNMKIIGVGGTKGKTTTAHLIAKLLAESGEGVAVLGTLGLDFYGLSDKWQNDEILRIKNEYGAYRAVNTTPGIDLIFKVLANSSKIGCTCAVIEISSQALACGRVYKLPISIAVFTNFSKDHIGAAEHKNIDEYRAAKLSLYDARVTVLNGDDALSADIMRIASKCYTVGTGDAFDFKISEIYSSSAHSSFRLNGAEISLSLGGAFNCKNAALAIAAVSVATGKYPSALSGYLSDFNVSGRYEVYELSGRRVVIDFAHNRESFRAIINAEQCESHGRIIVVFGSVGGRCEDRRRELAEVAEELADASVITADNPGEESARKICEQIYSFFEDRSKAQIVPDREAAIMKALSLSKEGDSILLLGKGHESFQVVGNRRQYFSERDIILSLGARRL